jgi:hypothetical protein
VMHNVGKCQTNQLRNVSALALGAGGLEFKSKRPTTHSLFFQFTLVERVAREPELDPS